MAASIESIEQPTLGEFRTRYVDRERPVVLRGAIREWPLFRTWTPEYLKSVLGARPVKVARSPDGGEYFDPETGVDYVRDFILPFDQFVDRVFAKDSTEKLYLLQASLTEFPELAGEVVAPDYPPRPILFQNLWIGSGGNITRCHYDMQDNLLAQVVGRKRVTLFPSRDLWRMYPRSPFGNKSNFSRVDVERPDFGRFPRFRDVPALETQLEPGDMLYIPIHWFHHVVSVDASVSLNYWWQPRRRQSLRPPALWYWPRIAASGYLQHEIAKLARRVTASVRGRSQSST
jgi:lysine-specific demethylase 8